MRLALDIDPQVLTVRRYAVGEIEIAGQLLRGPCIVSATQLIAEWAVGSAAALGPEALAPIFDLQPDIVLIGAGPIGAVAQRALREAGAARGIALEFMDVGAACRTYNVLAQERRRVVAGLFP